MFLSVTDLKRLSTAKVIKVNNRCKRLKDSGFYCEHGIIIEDISERFSMKKLVINGGKPLKGEVTISGAKNSTVALIPAAIIANEPVVLEGVPEIQDVDALI